MSGGGGQKTAFDAGVMPAAGGLTNVGGGVSPGGMDPKTLMMLSMSLGGLGSLSGALSGKPPAASGLAGMLPYLSLMQGKSPLG